MAVLIRSVLLVVRHGALLPNTTSNSPTSPTEELLHVRDHCRHPRAGQCYRARGHATGARYRRRPALQPQSPCLSVGRAHGRAPPAEIRSGAALPRRHVPRHGPHREIFEPRPALRSRWRQCRPQIHEKLWRAGARRRGRLDGYRAPHHAWNPGAHASHPLRRLLSIPMGAPRPTNPPSSLAPNTAAPA